VLREISGLDPAVLRQLIAAIREGRAQGKPDKDIAEEIKKLPVPANFIPRNPHELGIYLTIALAIITLWLNQCNRSTTPIINNDIQVTIVSQALEDLSQQTIEPRAKKEVVWISDLARASPIINARKFHSVVIRGPALVAFLDGCVLEDCTFNTDGSDPRSMVWQSLNPNGGIGFIALRGCKFYNCTFVGIGVTGSAGDIKTFLTNVR
jgi:hypothetical protein